MGDQVGGPFNAAHLGERKDVGHAGADARVQGASEVRLAVGAQVGKTDPRLRPGREGNERVEVGVECAA